MQKVNVMIGRFQPFTNGHLKCIEEAWKVKGVPTVICMVNTKDEKVDERKPFPSSLLLPLYEEAFAKNKHVAKIVLVVNADIVKIGEMLSKEGFESILAECTEQNEKVYGRSYNFDYDLSLIFNEDGSYATLPEYEDLSELETIMKLNRVFCGRDE